VYLLWSMRTGRGWGSSSWGRNEARRSSITGTAAGDTRERSRKSVRRSSQTSSLSFIQRVGRKLLSLPLTLNTLILFGNELTPPHLFLSFLLPFPRTSTPAIPTLFTFQPQGDIGKAPQNQILWLVQSPLGLPSPQYYSSPSIMAFYTRTIASLLTQTLPHSQTHLTDTLAKRIVSLEGELSRAGAKPEDLIDPSKAYNPMSFQELDKALPIDLTAYIESFLDGKDGGGRVIGREAVVTSKEYLREMGKILRAEEDWVLQAWFGVRAAMEYGPFLGDGEEVRKRVEELRNLLAGVKRPVAVDREEGTRNLSSSL
jgi:hypothetical protein